MKSAVIVFPGSNCDRDMAVALTKVTGEQPKMIWHGETELPDELDIIAIPGGFSYGDYLRCGAMASRTQIIEPILAAAKRGVRILGVCNGFQILTEIGLLPGALMRNSQMNFLCKDVQLQVENSTSHFSSGYSSKARIALPVAHHDGNYFANDDVLNELETEGRIVFRYSDNVNGSQRNIAGIVNREGNVLGMMPHPERAIELCHGGTDGLNLFESLAT
ncbi:MAG: phosphoribosylformylglycinamidine synthase subunit PurQ [Parasphingorhabdus sp.]